MIFSSLKKHMYFEIGNERCHKTFLSDTENGICKFHAKHRQLNMRQAVGGLTPEVWIKGSIGNRYLRH
jgi:hypothetical protein